MDDSRKRLLLLTTKIPSDVLFALSLPVFLTHHLTHDRCNAAQKMSTKLKQKDDDITYVEFCKMFVDIYQNTFVLKTCQKTYSSQISKGGSDLNYKMETFFRLIVEKIHQIYWNYDEDEMRMVRMKQMSEENQSCTMEIDSLNNKMHNIVVDHRDKVQEYEMKKNHFDDQVVKVFREAHLNKIRIEKKNRDAMLLNLMQREKELDELEQINKENKKKFFASKETNIAETGQIKKELLRKEEFLKTFSNRFSKDMLMRYKKKISLEQSIKEKKNTVETLKITLDKNNYTAFVISNILLTHGVHETVTSMSIHLEELQEAERVYLKREVYDKLDAIRERIALRTISEFIMPYVNLKFKSRKKKIKVKKLVLKKKIQ